jgi:hypothetical protein
MHMPAWAYNIEDPRISFEVVKGEDGKGWVDYYSEDLAEWQTRGS